MEIWIWGTIIGGVLTFIFYSMYKDETKGKENANERLNNLKNDVNQIISYKDKIDHNLKRIEIDEARLKKYEDDLNELVLQRSKGFPLLGEVYAQYLDLQGKLLSNKLIYKKHPAQKSADVVREVTKEKRELGRQLKTLEFKLKNYELIAPFLTEVEDTVVTQEQDSWILNDYTEEELQDDVVKFLTKEEYRKLSPGERNQLALDRYWARRKKSNWIIGKMYEHYVGYLYEAGGWEVEYFGIKERYEDFGRDLIATKGNLCHIIQCKNWSKYKTIYENHIFQLFGTSYEYQQSHLKSKIVPVFYTSTKLSETALEFAKRLGIEVKMNKKLEKYPDIKCNVSRIDKAKIYHLPFDQQYDTVKIEPKRKEFYCSTVKEAEDAGFRRAFRFKGLTKQ
ncbi:MAG: restriction endonuclease [Patescibacteria group bacterium]